MEISEILSHIDHTLLNPLATSGEIDKLCCEALEYHTASVCIPSCYVEYAAKKYTELNICTVVGFPLGYSTLSAKTAEVIDAVKNGANEIDMVVNLTDVKNGNFEAVTNEIKMLKYVCGTKTLKVIIETCYLTEEEKIRLCECVTVAGADYIKTSTGFGSAGADIEDIRLFKKHIGDSVKIKAAGGIKTKEQLEMFLNEGCDRIGTSSAVKILMGE